MAEPKADGPRDGVDPPDPVAPRGEIADQRDATVRSDDFRARQRDMAANLDAYLHGTPRDGRSTIPKPRSHPGDDPRTADERDAAADVRDQISDERDKAAEARDARADVRDIYANARDRFDAKHDAAAASDRAGAWRDRRAAAGDRAHAADDRRAASTDRVLSTRERRASSFDELTSAYRRDAGMVELVRETARAQRTQTSLVLAFVDVDGLKATNDSLGHIAGDRLLRRVVETIRTHLRAYDLIVRVGGDEFLCASLGATIGSVAERFSLVNADLAAHQHASVTAGLAELRASDSLDDLIARADAALVEQRQRGSTAGAI